MSRVTCAILVSVFVALASARAPWPELAATPPMGWNGWLTSTWISKPINTTEALYYDAADRLVSTGLRDLGYRQILVTCNGWIRDANGKIAVNPKTWPHGMEAYAKYLHDRGLLLGLYADTGPTNCCGEPGQYGHEEDDVRTFAEMGGDHIVIDNCGNPFHEDHARDEYARILDALIKVNKPMLIGEWCGGEGRPWTWGPDLGHYWRTGPDLGNKWAADKDQKMSIMFNYDLQQSVPGIADRSGPGGWNFLDNLSVGLPRDCPHKGDDTLTDVEAQTHYALWAIMNSPLFLNFDLRTVTADIMKIVSNPEVIAVNQDKLGRQAVRIDVGEASFRPLPSASPFPPTLSEILARPLEGDDWAVVLFNREEVAVDMTLHFTDIGDTTMTCFSLRDLWQRADLGTFNTSFTASAIPAHGNRMLRLKPCK